MSITKRKPSHATIKSTLFPINNKDEWNTKEGTGKSMKITLHILWYAKETSRATSNSEKIKHKALAIVELHWSEASGRQLVSQSVENSIE